MNQDLLDLQNKIEEDLDKKLSVAFSNLVNVIMQVDNTQALEQTDRDRIICSNLVPFMILMSERMNEYTKVIEKQIKKEVKNA